MKNVTSIISTLREGLHDVFWSYRGNLQPTTTCLIDECDEPELNKTYDDNVNLGSLCQCCKEQGAFVSQRDVLSRGLSRN
jgi:hypothetical protein